MERCKEGRKDKTELRKKGQKVKKYKNATPMRKEQVKRGIKTLRGEILKHKRKKTRRRTIFDSRRNDCKTEKQKTHKEERLKSEKNTRMS